MAHQMKNLCVFSVLHCVEGAFGASSRGTPKLKHGVPRDELKNGCGCVCTVPYFGLSGPVLRDPARLSRRYPPLLRAMGLWCLNTAIRARYPLPFFERYPPWRACEVEVRYPPLKRRISAILARDHMKTRQMGAIPPSAILSRKGIAREGGVSRTGPLRFRTATAFSSFLIFPTGLLRQGWRAEGLCPSDVSPKRGEGVPEQGP